MQKITEELNLFLQIAENGKLLLEIACPAQPTAFAMDGTSTATVTAAERANKLAASAEASRLAPRLHLLCLLFEVS